MVSLTIANWVSVWLIITTVESKDTFTNQLVLLLAHLLLKQHPKVSLSLSTKRVAILLENSQTMPSQEVSDRDQLQLRPVTTSSSSSLSTHSKADSISMLKPYVVWHQLMPVQFLV